MKRIIMILPCLLMSFIYVSAFGNVIGINDFSGSEEIITFEPAFGPAFPGSIPSPYTVFSTLSNITFTSLSSDSGLNANGDWGAFAITPGASQGNALFDRAIDEPSNLLLEFSSPLFRVGMWLTGGNWATSWEISILDQSGLVIESAIFIYEGEFSYEFPRPSTFVGFESVNPIAKLTIAEQSINGQFTGINDLRMEIPEPTTLSLLTLGAFLAGRKRRTV